MILAFSRGPEPSYNEGLLNLYLEALERETWGNPLNRSSPRMRIIEREEEDEAGRDGKGECRERGTGREDVPARSYCGA